MRCKVRNECPIKKQARKKELWKSVLYRFTFVILSLSFTWCYLPSIPRKSINLNFLQFPPKWAFAIQSGKTNLNPIQFCLFNFRTTEHVCWMLLGPYIQLPDLYIQCYKYGGSKIVQILADGSLKVFHKLHLKARLCWLFNSVNTLDPLSKLFVIRFNSSISKFYQ